MKITATRSDKFYKEVIELLIKAKENVVQSINTTMVKTYYEIGRLIVTEEQFGNRKAKYGQQLINKLSERLSSEFGKGFSETNIKQMRSFYLSYSIGQKPSDQFRLSWSHYLKLMRIDDINERRFYEIETFKNNWSLKELQRQFDSALYTRIKLGMDKNKPNELSEKGLIINNPKDTIKDPYILEFLELPEHSKYIESDLEAGLINKLEQFLLELGTGFSFVARQKRITFYDRHFYIDLVFYNRIVKCFLLIDLKIGELKHKDIGQMQMYVNYYDREIILPEENKTLGLILCQNKNESVIRYTLPENNTQIFASKYQTILPSKEILKEILEK